MGYKNKVAIAYVLALFMEFLDGAIIHVAVPALEQHFGVVTSQVHWVATAYLLAIALCLPISGWLSDRCGAKQVFVWATGLFGLGSLLGAAAPSLSCLIAARVLQGAGGGLMGPVGSTLLMRAFPAEERARVASVVMVPALLAPAMAPWLGGLLVTHATWRWIFAVNLPVAAVVWAWSYFSLRGDAYRSVKPLDLPGLLTAGIGLGCAFWVMSQLSLGAGAAPWVIGMGGLGAASLALFIAWQLRAAAPLLDLRLLADPSFRLGATLQFMLIAGLCGGLFCVAQCQQKLLGQSALTTGSISSMQALGIIPSIVVAGRLSERLGRGFFVMLGLALCAAATFALSRPGILVSPQLLSLVLVVRGIGLGGCLSLTWVEAFSQMPAARMAQASALMNVVIQLGQAVAVALCAAYLTHRQLATGGVHMTAFVDVFAGLGALATLSLLAAVCMRRQAVPADLAGATT